MSTDTQKARNTAPILVIGFGNPLLGDDGLGIVAVTELRRRYSFPEQVEVLDGGTSSIGGYEILANRSQLIAVDAVVCGKPPGTVIRLRGDQIPVAFGKPMSPHDLGLADTLALLKAAGDYPGRLSVLGMVPRCLNAGEGLSEEVAANMNALVEKIVEELRESGLGLMPLAGG